MFATLHNTGGRVSEITGMLVSDVVLDGSAAVRIRGKGRKERSVPLWRTTATEIRKWLARVDGKPDQPRSEEHTSELQSHLNLVCRLLLEKKKKKKAVQHLENHVLDENDYVSAR